MFKWIMIIVLCVGLIAIGYFNYCNNRSANLRLDAMSQALIWQQIQIGMMQAQIDSLKTLNANMGTLILDRIDYWEAGNKIAVRLWKEHKDEN